MKDTLVVNLFGAPGTGKSTGAAYIFSQLKMRGIDVEYVPEFAKDKVWEEDTEVFKNQAYLFGKQSFRISRCDGKVDVIITDSPLPLSIIYNNDPRLTENFNKTVMDVFNSYNNLNFLLYRVKEYNPNGRHQTAEEADKKFEEIQNMLDERDIEYYKNIPGIKYGYDEILKIILTHLNKEN